MESLNSTLPSTFNIPVAYLKNYSQQLMKIWGDKTDTLNPSDLLRFKLPNTVIDLKTLNFIFEFTTSAVGLNTQYQNRYFPRLSSSLLGSVAVYINGVLVDNVQNYNQLFCLLYDAQSASTTSSIRYQEANDPSFKSSVTNTGTITNTIQGNSTGTTADDSDIARQFSIRSWIGFLGSLNTSIIDVSKIGEVVLEFTMSPASIIWKGVQPAGGVVASPSVQNYTVKNYYMTVNRISFGDDLYSSYIEYLPPALLFHALERNNRARHHLHPTRPLHLTLDLLLH